MQIFKSQVIESFTRLVLLMMSLSGVAYIQLGQINKLLSKDSIPEVSRRQEKIEAAALALSSRLPDFGYRNLLADWQFLQFLQYFGDRPARNLLGYSLVPKYFESVVKRDPKFIDAYFYFSPANSLFAGRADRSVALLDLGLQSIVPQTPDAYYLWLYKGIDQLLFLDAGNDAKHSFLMASQWARIQNTPSSLRVAASAAQTASFLERNPISRSAKISAWMTTLSNVKGDPNAERFVLQRIESLGAKVTISPRGEVQIVVPRED
jgi:hypothetical protein